MHLAYAVRTVVLGLVASAASMIFVIAVLVVEMLFMDESASNLLSDSVKQSATLTTVILVCSASTMILANVGLMIGYLRKLRHLPRYGRR